MPVAQDLPTEVLYSIFELSPYRTLPGSTLSSNSTFTDIQSPAEFCSLSSLKEISLHHITLSHVCARWRDVAIGLECLWEQLYLSGNAFNPSDEDFISTTRDFLSRSSAHALSLDIMIDDPSFSSSSTITQLAENISTTLYTHIGRCHSLRLFASDLVISAILDIFMEYNISSPPIHPSSRHAPLSHLHIVQTTRTTGQSTFPLDLTLVAPQLTFLRVEHAEISAFPRWHLHSVALIDSFLSYHSHFQLFQKSASRKLLLDKIFIPGGIPYVRRLMEQPPSLITSLTLSRLQCARAYEDKIGEDEQRGIYAMFFTLTLFHTLRELELTELDGVTLSGLLAMLRANPPVVFVDLCRLTLRRVDVTITRGRVNLATALVHAFPGVCEVVLEDVEGGEVLVGLWKSSPMMQYGSQIWTRLEEMLVDGCVVQRML
ncbi:hypothetical protein M413DRAFT_271099 [Hebeloma cylindrosporum]|uniref:Uncharacterized protein n=1 Tax=Hebeloma cylindrosporum TaxID=76867 RepID=A0A0C3CT02_HEBCY|nr:hypothetical protein M413DRAFT_271099 [Hebeloma cylindrosporum h7]